MLPLQGERSRTVWGCGEVGSFCRVRQWGLTEFCKTRGVCAGEGSRAEALVRCPPHPALLCPLRLCPPPLVQQRSRGPGSQAAHGHVFGQKR